MADPIETLTVAVEGDVSGLLNDIDQGVDKSKDKLDELGDAGKKSGGSISKSAAMAGAAFGLASAGATMLLDVVVNIASSAVEMFKGLANEAIALASDFEQVQMTFTNIFKDENKANAFLKDLRGEAARLGISFQDAGQFAKSIFPDTENAEEFNRILKNAAIGAADAGLPLSELIFSFNEAVAGDFVSIRDRLDIPKEVIERIKAAPNTVGALNEELEKLFAKRGVDNLEAMSNTFDGLKRQISGFREGLLGLAGQKILEPLREGLASIVGIIKEYAPNLNDIASQFGEIVAMVVDFARTEIFNEIFNPVVAFSFVDALKTGVEWLKETVAAFLEGAKAALAFGEQFGGLVAAFTFVWDAIKLIIGGIGAMIMNFTPLGEAIKIVSTRIDEAGGGMAAFKSAMVAGAQATAIVTAVIVGMQTALKGTLVALGGMGKAIGSLLVGDLDGLKNGLTQANEGIRQVTEQSAADLKKSMLDSAEAIESRTSPAVKELEKDVKKLGSTIEETAEVAEEKPLLDPAKLEKYGDQLADAAENREKQQAELEKGTADKIKGIMEDANNQKLAIEEKYNDDLAKLAEDSEAKRASIIDKTRQQLADLSENTDKQLKARKGDFNKAELRQTEDHLKAMRRMQENFLFDLDDAVRSRDAGAIVDLQRRFQKESSQKEEDFATGQGRQKEDFNQELAGIRQNEADRRAEILEAQAKGLEDVRKNAEDKKLMIEDQRREADEKLEQNLADRLQKENDNFIQRQTALDDALKKQLEAIAKNLVDEKEVTEEGAREILETFDEYFGIGGNIDELMSDFSRRRKIRADITVAFNGPAEEPPPPPPTVSQRLQSGQSAQGGRRLGGIQEFAEGGTLVASTPTLALFGEAGPEVVQFTPMSQLSNAGGNAPGRMIIEMTGSAPPGIGGSERDQIAAVLLTALQSSGALG